MTKLELRFFGGLHVSLDDAPLTALGYRKARALLCYLAVTGKIFPRSSLAGLLWPDLPESSARAGLRKALFQLNQHLSQHLSITRETISFNSEVRYSMDVADFTARVAVQSDVTSLQEAVSLYRGDFLDQFSLPDAQPFDEWAHGLRVHLRDKVQCALGALVTHFANCRSYDAALAYARQMISIEPWQEQAHREVIRLLALTGQRSAAIRQFEVCRRILAEELNVDPDAETVSLYEQVKQGNLSDQLLLKPDFIVGPGSARRSLEPPRRMIPGLPMPAKLLIGRTGELDQVQDRLMRPEVQLVTITGPGGIGKTHLGSEVARRMLETNRFTDGVYFVSLSSIKTRQHLLAAIAHRLNLPVSGTRNPEEALCQLLNGRNYLVVLDNFEQLLSQVGFVEQLLLASPGSKWLITSRERLRIQAEWVVDLEGLAFPESDLDGKASTYPAVALFAHRAQQVRARFSLEENLGAVVRICRLTQGLPLALELAASSIRVNSAVDIADQIENSLVDLSTTLSDLPQRHHSLRAVLDSSWQKLDQRERLVFSRLSVFRDGFTLDAAKHVAGLSLGILSGLIDKSLIRRRSGGNGKSRYLIHDLLRRYAVDQLHAAGRAEVMDVAGSHLSYYLSLAEQTEEHWDTSQEIEWLRELEDERGNFHAALQWAIENGRSDAAIRLNAALFTFWVYVSPSGEALDRLEESLAGESETQSRDLAHARAKAFAVAGYAALQVSDCTKAKDYFAQGLSRYSLLEDSRGMAWALRGRGFALLIEGGLDQALAHVLESLAICEGTQDAWGMAWSSYDLGNIALASDDLETAERHLQAALTGFQLLEIPFGIYRVRISLGHLYRRMNLIDKARAEYRQALRIQEDTRFVQFGAQVFEGIAHIGALGEDWEGAVRLFGVGQARRDSIEMARWAYQQAEYRQALALTKANLEASAWQTAWESGYSMPFRDAVAFACSVTEG